MAGGIVDSGFGLGVENAMAWVDFCGANIGDIWAVVGPSWVEDVVVWAETSRWSVIAAESDGGVSNARIPAGEEEGDSLKPELEVFVALAFLVGDRNVGFLAAVRDGEDVCRLVDAALELALVAVWSWIGVGRVDVW